MKIVSNDQLVSDWIYTNSHIESFHFSIIQFCEFENEISNRNIKKFLETTMNMDSIWCVENRMKQVNKFKIWLKTIEFCGFNWKCVVAFLLSFEHDVKTILIFFTTWFRNNEFNGYKYCTLYQFQTYVTKVFVQKLVENIQMRIFSHWWPLGNVNTSKFTYH